MAQVARILDANANRAREAVRVMEEAARFLLEDAELSQACKAMRHDLAAALEGVPDLEPSRDAPGDVGAAIQTEREGERASATQVVIAAGKRLSEALRALEEYGKTLPSHPTPASPPFPARIEGLRYRGYDLEQRLHTAMSAGQAPQWRLCVLLSESLCRGHDWRRVARAVLEAGADCVQLREKAMEAGELLTRARELRALASQAAGEARPRACVIVNDRPDVALLAGADGVHLGPEDLPCREARRLIGHPLRVGVSTSTLAEAKQARREGADYCGVGPMFPSTTKEKKVRAGPAYLREFVAWGGLPHLAIGGITPRNVSELIEAGARGVAVSSAICTAEDPAAVTRHLRSAWP